MKSYKNGKILSPKQEALERINNGFNGAFNLGFNCSFGYKINCARSDKQNMDSLLQYMESMNISSVNFRTYDNTFVFLTKDQLRQLILELVGYGLWLYQYKWYLEALIETCKTIDEYNSIDW